MKESILLNYNDYEKFEKGYTFTKQDQELFFQWLDEEGFSFDVNLLQKDIKIIENRLIAEIINSIWGKELAYRKRLQIDEQISVALKNIDMAKQIIE